MTRVEQLWQETMAQTAGPRGTSLFRRIDETHPLDLYAGIDYQGKRVLMLVAHKRPPTLPSPGVVEVACNQRGDKEFAIILQMARQEFEEVFGRLCQDLVDATRDTTPDQGGDALLRRLSRWRKLLEVGQRTTLSDAALRGLVGELWFLHSVAIPRVGVDPGVNGWVGPLDAPQDFLLGESLVEMKTCLPGSREVTITSLQQLDTGNASLYLGVVWLAPAGPMLPGAFSVAQLVSSIRKTIEASPATSTEFELRLAEAGYADSGDYERTCYRVTQTKYFHVRDAFPRVVRAGAPAGVMAATYVIDLGVCEAYECQF